MDLIRAYRKLLLFIVLATSASSAHAISFALDSIAEWGRFPRFCVNTYRWGDKFFNGYDTAYVKGTGYKFNVKLRADSWLDYYNFDLPDNMRMRMMSDPSTTAGVWLTYLAVSIGYDKNISRFFGSSEKTKQQFTFGFGCSLFTFNMYYIDNDVGTHISRFGKYFDTFNPDIDFDGAHTKSLGADLSYFFNHKKYSQPAAFNYSRVQTASQGSFFAGLSLSKHQYSFDFSSLPQYMKDVFPSSWRDYTYEATIRNYALKLGYGYNWVFAKNWVLAVSESPAIGIKKGFINSETEKTTFALSNILKVSVVWNSGRWFAGAVGDVNLDILYDKESTFENAIISGNISVGYRFNIW